MTKEIFDLVIKNGTLVSAADTFRADLAISGETIASVGIDLHGREEINAAGKLVIPGGVDPHVHLEMPVGQTRSSDDWETGTIAAAIGGTTTVIDFVEPSRNEPLLDALAARKKQADGKSCIDYALHMTLTNDLPETLLQIPDVIQAGCSSFKTYLTYEGLKLSDDAFLNVLFAVKDHHGLILVHAENDAIINSLKSAFLDQGKLAPRFHPLSHPAVSESEAITRALALARTAEALLYIVHISTAGGVNALEQARDDGQLVFGETCPQYLLLTDREFERPGFESSKFVCSPPLRTDPDRERLWHALSHGSLDTIGTDHCPFFFKGQKELGREDFTRIPGGLPGIESRLALLYSFGVGTGRISLNRWVALCATNAARIFNLYPRKGSLAPGSDADLVIFDPNRKVTMTKSMLHENVDYTPYEGMQLTGYPEMTIAAGKILAQNGNFIGEKGRGRFIRR